MSSLKQVFTDSHRQLEALFEAAIENLRGPAPGADAFLRFQKSIERHMQAEEATLFPRYESAGHGDALPEILKKGHRDLRAFFVEILEAIAAADVEESLALMHIVEEILKHHDEKEESELYPALEQEWTPGEVERLARQLE